MTLVDHRRVRLTLDLECSGAVLLGLCTLLKDARGALGLRHAIGEVIEQGIAERMHSGAVWRVSVVSGLLKSLPDADQCAGERSEARASEASEDASREAPVEGGKPEQEALPGVGDRREAAPTQLAGGKLDNPLASQASRWVEAARDDQCAGERWGVDGKLLPRLPF